MARLGKEINVVTDNKVGVLAQVTAPLKEAGVNIEALCGWGEEDEGNILLVTNDNAKGIEALSQAGFSPTEKEVVLVELDNQVGTIAEAGQKLSEAGVHITYCYVSAVGPKALAVLATRDNAKAVEVLG